MVCKGGERDSRGIGEEPEIAALAALVREGKISRERLTAEIEGRQLPLFTAIDGGVKHDNHGG